MKSISPQHFTRLNKSIISFLILICIILVTYLLLQNNNEKLSYTFELSDSTNIVYKTNPDFITLPDTSININTANLYELQRIGLTIKQANTIHNYIKKYGPFSTIDELNKIYGISENKIAKIKSQVYVISKKNNKKPIESKTSNKLKFEIKKFDLNSCDTSDLRKIHGIGSFRAKKIIEYRDALGGFFTYNQLLQVYSIDSTILDKIKNNTLIDTQNITKININTATFKQIQSHPYCGYYISKDIISYRKLQGSIQNINELIKNKILQEEDFEQVRMYLKTF